MIVTDKFSVRKLCVGFIVLMFLIGNGLVSCASRKNIAYFNHTSDSTNAVALATYTPVFKVGDIIEIIVTSPNKEASELFNLPLRTVRAGYESGGQTSDGYLVNGDGFIDFPIIGKVQVAGKNKTELYTEITSRLSGYLETPIALIRIANFKVTVLGDVLNPGTFAIPNERVTLLEVLGIAGDLNMTGKRKNVLVIREENGEKKETRVDLTSEDVFKSPVYFLHQNDVVYVEPNQVKMNGSLYSPVYAVLISVTTLLITTISILAR